MNLLDIQKKQKPFSMIAQDDNQEYAYISDIQAQLKACIRLHQQILQLVTYSNYQHVPGTFSSRMCLWLNPLKPELKSHLLFAGIIRSSPFSPR